MQARRDHGGTHFILLVEPMFALGCLASLPGTPRRALDAAGLVLVWLVLFCNGCGNAIGKQTGVDNDYCKRDVWHGSAACGVITFAVIPSRNH
jgi:hypothetical protein